MSNKRCATCYFHDKCRGVKVCKDYYPITEDAIDECLNELIAEDYRMFCDEWAEYIRKFFD